MAQVKDKIVTVESLSAVHDYNKKTYLPMVNPEVEGNLTITGDLSASGNGSFVGNVTVDDIALVKSTDIISIENGGTNAADGAEGLKNLFNAGATVLSSYQYGDELPEAGIAGRIFFKKLVE